MKAKRRCRTNRGTARKSGLTHGYVSRVMRGLKDPRFSTARRIADARGITLDTLAKEIDKGKDKVVDPSLSERISSGVKLKNEFRSAVEEEMRRG